MGEGIGLYVILIGLGEPPGFRLLALSIFVMAFSTVVGAVSALPGGLGAAEVSMTGMLGAAGWPGRGSRFVCHSFDTDWYVMVWRPAGLDRVGWFRQRCWD